MKKEIRDFVKNDRRDFKSEPLLEEHAGSDPFALFAKWFEDVVKYNLQDPYAFTLATADSKGRPAARVLYMRDFSPLGLTCFTNYNSLKGHHLEENPQFSANFVWLEFNRQVRFSGVAERLPAAESDAYFASRPRESQIGAWASNQSEVIEGRNTLNERVEMFKARFEGAEVPRPEHWGGYLLMPDAIEFWQGRQSRLHDRLEYLKTSDNSWTIKRLSP